MKKYRCALAAVALFCSSCLSLVPVEDPQEGKAPKAESLPECAGRIVFGRPANDFMMRSVVVVASLGRMKVAMIKDGEYASVAAEPGKYVFHVEGILSGGAAPLYADDLVLNVATGAPLYVELNPIPKMKFADMFGVFDEPRLDYSRLSRAKGAVAAVKAADSPALPAVAAAAPGAITVQPATGKNPIEPIPGRSVLAKNAIAVVIGNKDYERGMSPVAYALNDASAFRDTLVKSFGLDPKDIWYSPNAGLAELISLFGSTEDYKRSRIYRAASLRPQPPDLILYYSGHGAPSLSGDTKGKGYLVPVDADVLAIATTGFAIDSLLANLAAMKAENAIGRSWICFDACFSGQAGDGKLLVKDVSGLAVMPVAPKAKIEDGVVMFASSGEEFASWYPEEQHGLFTYFLLKGLAGAADADSDRSIGVAELGAYLRSWVPRYASGLNAQEQTPQILSAGEIPGFLTLKK